MSLVLDLITKRFDTLVCTTCRSPSSRAGIFGLLGANGAGKTTSMLIVLDILWAYERRATWNGTRSVLRATRVAR